jgi:hypothetical protein
MTSKLPLGKNSQKNDQIMFQICVHDQKVQGMTFQKRFLNAKLGTSKYTIFLILLKIQNLWNLRNVFIKKIMKIFI